MAALIERGWRAMTSGRSFVAWRFVAQLLRGQALAVVPLAVLSRAGLGSRRAASRGARAGGARGPQGIGNRRAGAMGARAGRPAVDLPAEFATPLAREHLTSEVGVVYPPDRAVARLGTRGGTS